ncbi:hypothetical protein D3C86_2024420 [compost metagenome]
MRGPEIPSMVTEAAVALPSFQILKKVVDSKAVRLVPDMSHMNVPPGLNCSTVPMKVH